MDAMSEQEDRKDPQTAAIIGAAMEVHNELGCGFHEPVYQEAMEVELELRGIPFSREVALPCTTRGGFSSPRIVRTSSASAK